MASPAFPGMFFAFAAAILLLFASVSPPAWQRVSFLRVSAGSLSETVYGVFGKCIANTCTKRAIGYNLQAAGVDTTNMDTSLLHNLSKTLVLHPIAGGLSLFAFFFGLAGVSFASRGATIMMALTSFLGLVVGLVAFVIDMVLWNVLKNRVHDNGYHAQLGNANWLTVGAVFSMALATCTSCCGSFGRFATGRSAGEKY